MKNRIGKFRIGLFLWFLACFLPSLLTSYLESKALNAIPGFYRSPSDTFEIALLLTVITAIVTSPIAALVWFKMKRKERSSKDALHVIGFILASGLFVFTFQIYLTISFVEAAYITLPCLFLFLIFSSIFMKKNPIQ